MAMKSKQLAAVAAMLGGLVYSGAMAQTPATASAPTTKTDDAKWSSDSIVGDLLDYAPAKAVLVKHLPEIAKDDQIEMVRGLTLRSLQSFSPDQLTDDLLVKIDADLAKLPPRGASAATSK
jgi:hypothetical protein